MEFICALILLLILTNRLISARLPDDDLTEDEMERTLDEYNRGAESKCTRGALANWELSHNFLNESYRDMMNELNQDHMNYERRYFEKFWKDANPDKYKNETIQMQLKFLKQQGVNSLSEHETNVFFMLKGRLDEAIARHLICPYDVKNCNKSVDGLDFTEINEVFAHSRDFDELKHLWSDWHNGSTVWYTDFLQTGALLNKAARISGFDNAADEERDGYKEQQINSFWDKLQPLYDQLHIYTRYKLLEIYGDKINRNISSIPVHLLGDIEGKSFVELFNDIRPFKNITSFDVTGKMQAIKLTVHNMFEIANDFFTSLGLLSMEVAYDHDLIMKPDNHSGPCHAFSQDYCDGKIFRTQMCTQITMQDLTNIHHELGHIQYAMQYKHLPYTLRRSPKTYLHEAIGETVALSSSTATHLQKIGLLENYDDSYAANINKLLYMALEKVAFIPFSIIMDKWRWDVLSGEIEAKDHNTHWWNLRKTYQNIVPPENRSSDGFDAGAKHHTAQHEPYTQYYLATIFQFQLYRSLCIAAKQYDPDNKKSKPLHKCDFYKSHEAGQLLAKGLKLGASVLEETVLRVLTNESEMSTDAMVEYFQPLYDFLVEENKHLYKEDLHRGKLHEFNKKLEELAYRANLLRWKVAYHDNGTLYREDFEKASMQEVIFHKRQVIDYFREVNESDFRDECMRRQVSFIKQMHISALEPNELYERDMVLEDLQQVHMNAQICHYQDRDNCSKTMVLDGEDGIIETMANETDYETLKYLWTAWHDETGPKVRNFYGKYIYLSNLVKAQHEGKDYGALWREEYQDPNFEKTVLDLWERIKPLYDELHTYTRYKLLDIYGNKMDGSDGLIPAHLVGDPFGQTWINLFERIKPFKNAAAINITETLKAKGYTVLRIFDETDQFFQSIGLESAEKYYKGESILFPIPGKMDSCTSMAWDMGNGDDFRIKQCTLVNHRYYVMTHHEMGHIHYYMLYKDLPILLRAGPNPGFHEAIGDTISLSAGSTTHLKKMGFLQNFKDSEEDNINFLFLMALERVAFMPYGLLIDLYRWELFSGKIPENRWTKRFEELREQYQKLRSPVTRNETHFDAGAKFHVAYDAQFINYYVAHIIQFQLYRALCKISGNYDPNDPSKPLHKCDFEGSLKAGRRLRAGLGLGRSKHWSEVLRILTDGETELSADAILEYFKPLHEFLIEENEKRAPASHVLLVFSITVFVLMSAAAFAIGNYRYNWVANFLHNWG